MPTSGDAGKQLKDFYMLYEILTVARENVDSAATLLILARLYKLRVVITYTKETGLGLKITL